MTAISTKMNDHTKDMDNKEKRSQAMKRKNRAQFVIDLDDGVTALKDIKSDVKKSGKIPPIHEVDTVTPIKDTKAPRYKGTLPKLGTMVMQK